jgi:hypothetical protein
VKVKDVINETPLPSGWDRRVFAPETDFDDKIEYALRRAKKIKTGSSRVVMTIKYEGRDTALKVATWEAGIAQNRNEVKILRDKRFADILVPLIDWDRDNRSPEWIQVEKVKPMTTKLFTALIGMSPSEFAAALADFAGYVKTNGEKISPILPRVMNLAVKYNLTIGDLTSPQNWGVFEGRPVLIDVGTDERTYDSYY